MNESYQKVYEMHKLSETPYNDFPTILTQDRVVKRAGWIESEKIELLEARSISEQVDAFIDIMYFCFGGLVEMGVKPESIFNIVHKSNLAKVWPDGKIHKDENSKWIKPPSWVSPDAEIESEINKQLKV